MSHDAQLHITHAIIDEVFAKRKELGLSHEKLAVAAGLHRSAISLIERKQRIPSLLTILKICKALEVSLGKVVAKFE